MGEDPQFAGHSAGLAGADAAPIGQGGRTDFAGQGVVVEVHGHHSADASGVGELVGGDGFDQGAERVSELLPIGRWLIQHGFGRVGLFDLGCVDRVQRVFEHGALGFGDDELAFVGAVTAVGDPEVGRFERTFLTPFKDVVLVPIHLLGGKHLADAVGPSAEVFEGELGCVAQQLGFAGFALLGRWVTGKVLDSAGDQLSLRQRHLAPTERFLGLRHRLEPRRLPQHLLGCGWVTTERVGQQRTGRGRTQRRSSLGGLQGTRCGELVGFHPRLEPAECFAFGDDLSWCETGIGIEWHSSQRCGDCG